MMVTSQKEMKKTFTNTTRKWSAEEETREQKLVKKIIPLIKTDFNLRCHGSTASSKVRVRTFTPSRRSRTASMTANSLMKTRKLSRMKETENFIRRKYSVD